MAASEPAPLHLVGDDGRATTRPVAARSAKGHLMIVGGGAMPAAIIDRFVELAGGPDAAHVAILPMASEVAEATARHEVEWFRARGVRSVEVLNLTKDEARDEAVADRFAKVTGIWFSGGDQTKLMAVLRDTPAAAAIHARYRAGAVVGGTSAGAAVMSRLMIPGGERRPLPTTGPVTDTGTYQTIERDNVLLSEGLGLLPEAVVDQHFLRRRRHNRLLSVVLERPNLIGVGIDESTALLVRPDGRWEVVGESAVLIYDARGAQVTAPGAGHGVGATDLRLHVLPRGGRYDPQTGEAWPAPEPVRQEAEGEAEAAWRVSVATLISYGRASLPPLARTCQFARHTSQ